MSGESVQQPVSSCSSAVWILNDDSVIQLSAMIPQSNLSSFKVLVFTVNASYLKRMNEGGGGEKGGRHLYTECFPLVLWGHFGKTEFFFLW
jgi:hypothetical protein